MEWRHELLLSATGEPTAAAESHILLSKLLYNCLHYLISAAKVLMDHFQVSWVNNRVYGN